MPVDTDGNRMYDKRVNVLTVVANESYRTFVQGLQSEYSEEGYKSLPEPANARERVEVKFTYAKRKLPDDFAKLWEKIQRKTTYNITLKSNGLIKQCIEKINELEPRSLVVRVERVQVEMSERGKVETIFQNEAVGGKLKTDIRITNIIDRIARETGITKKTVHAILSKVDNLDLIFKNPEEYVRSVIVIIRNTLNDTLINEGLEYTPTGKTWELNIFEDFWWYKERAVKSNRSVFGYVAVDSAGEKAFAENLDRHNRVKVFTKLPSGFTVDTPLGTYNPDWAIVMDTDDGEKLYLVRETKFVEDRENLRPSEERKIKCGQLHFEALDVPFKVSTQEDLSDLV